MREHFKLHLKVHLRFHLREHLKLHEKLRKRSIWQWSWWSTCQFNWECICGYIKLNLRVHLAIYIKAHKKVHLRLDLRVHFRFHLCCTCIAPAGDSLMPKCARNNSPNWTWCCTRRYISWWTSGQIILLPLLSKLLIICIIGRTWDLLKYHMFVEQLFFNLAEQQVVRFLPQKHL